MGQKTNRPVGRLAHRPTGFYLCFKSQEADGTSAAALNYSWEAADGALVADFLVDFLAVDFLAARAFGDFFAAAFLPAAFFLVDFLAGFLAAFFFAMVMAPSVVAPAFITVVYPPGAPKNRGETSSEQKFR